MMEQIRMGTPDSRGHSFQRDALRTGVDQQLPRGFQRGKAAFLWW
jgi:hypothetical protein